MTSNHKEEEEMSMKEREDWLRSHGVKIETPETRQAAANAAATGIPSILRQMMGGLALEEEEEELIEFVCVPHDDSLSIRSLHLPSSVAKATPGDALPDFVKPYFASDGKSIDASLLKEQATKQFAGGDMAQLANAKLTPSAMNAVAAEGSVETFPLVHPADTNGYQGVYIYLDEVGLLKKLPNNARASQIAQACGYHPPPIFYGDVFIGRVQTQPAPLRNIDFLAGKDTDKGALWMQRAIAENLAWQQEMNRVTGKGGEERRQESQVGTDGKAATEDSFEWTQDEDELELVIPSTILVLVGDSDNSSSDVTTKKLDKKSIKVTFLSRSIKVSYGGMEKLKLDLYGAIDLDGSTWTIDGGTKLVLTCEKANAGEMWPRIKN